MPWEGKQSNDQLLKMGLGIDAGGTYTDAVIYDFLAGMVLSKNKALTTKWDFTVGIKETLDGLDKNLLARTDLAAVSTTLATNAVVEGEGQHVGLLIMPPYGLFEEKDIPYEPKAVISGRLEISGEVTVPYQDLPVPSTRSRNYMSNAS
jgi:N-methylhydantoinase A/oxoprolinase/acetone carboxylase beta subunit